MNSSLNQKTYDDFKRDIMSCKLKPGEQVSAMKIAERYNVSRTPAREALVKLEAEGLIDIFPQSKSIISRIDVARAKQEWFIRTTLELGMVDILFERGISEDVIAKAKGLSNRMHEILLDPADEDVEFEYISCDNSLHELTYIAAGQPLAAETIRILPAHYNRVRLLVDRETSFKRRTISSHDKLIDALERGDKEDYRALLTEHLGYINKDIVNMQKKYPDYFK